jgi:RimJ/RimL family protein N-acetyltransferase
MAFIETVTLVGQHLVLEPLQPDHHDAIVNAATDGELWKLWYTSVPSPEQTSAWIDAAAAMREQNGTLAFAVRATDTGAIVGSTRFCNVDSANRRLEIGYTWYATRVQRTALNTECKLMMLTHAFEKLGCIAVEFRTHWMNHQSRAAIARLGAKQDGILRNHQRMADGSLRDTVVFSIVASEWPAVKRHLQYQLER